MRLKVQIVDELRLKKPERPTSGVEDWNVCSIEYSIEYDCCIGSGRGGM